MKYRFVQARRPLQASSAIEFSVCRRFGLLMIATALVLFACGGKEKPPLTPDGPETETTAGDAGTVPEPDPK